MPRGEGTIVTRYVGDGTHLLRTNRQVRGSLMGVTKEIDRANARMAKLSGALNTAFRVSAITGSIYALSRAFGVIIANAGQFEYALAGIAKTTNLSNPSVERLGKTLLKASINMGQARIEMLEVAKVAGQLGIHGQRDLAKFTIAITKLSGASNLAAEEGATHLARFLYLTNNTPQAAERVASSIVHLGNNVAATESEILRMATAIAQTTASLSLSDTFISGWAATVAAAGLRVESTSNATFRFMEGIQVASRESGAALQKLADAIDMPINKAKEFIDQDLEGFVRSLITNLANFDPSSITSLLYALGIDDIRTHRSINTTIQQERATGAFSNNIALAESQSLQAEALNREFQRKRETLLHDIESINQRMGSAFERISSVIVDRLLPAYDRMASIIEAIAKYFGPILNVLSLFLTLPVAGGVGAAVGGFRAYRTLRYGNAAARKDRRIRRAEDPDYVGRPEDADSPSVGLDQRRAALDHYVPLARRGIARKLMKNPEMVDELEKDMAELLRYQRETLFSIGKQRVQGEINIIKKAGLGALIGGGSAAGIGGLNSAGADSIASRRNMLYGEDSPLRFTAFKDDEQYGKFILALSNDAEVKKEFVEKMDGLIARLEGINNSGAFTEMARLLDAEGEADKFKDATTYDDSVSVNRYRRDLDGNITIDDRPPQLSNLASVLRRSGGGPSAGLDLYNFLAPGRLSSGEAANFGGAFRRPIPPNNTNFIGSLAGNPGLFAPSVTQRRQEQEVEEEIFNQTIKGFVMGFANKVKQATKRLTEGYTRSFEAELDTFEDQRHRGLLSVSRGRRALVGSDSPEHQIAHERAMLALTERRVNAEADLGQTQAEYNRLSLIEHDEGSQGAKDLVEATRKLAVLNETILRINVETGALKDSYAIRDKLYKLQQKADAARRQRLDMQANVDEEGFFDTFQALPTFAEEATAAMDRFAGSYMAYTENMEQSTKNLNDQVDRLAENLKRVQDTTEHMGAVFQDVLDENLEKVEELGASISNLITNPLREFFNDGSFREGLKNAIDGLRAHINEILFIEPIERALKTATDGLAADFLGYSDEQQEAMGIKTPKVEIEAEHVSLGGSGGGAGGQDRFANMQGWSSIWGDISNLANPGGGSNGFGPGLSFPSGLGNLLGGGGGGAAAGGGLFDFVGNLFGGGGGGGGLLDFASSFLGFFADGGVTPRAGFAVVGERGPEIVSLPGGAAVHPNGSMPGGMGQAINVTNVINVEGVQDPGTVRAEVEAQIPMITAATRSALTAEARNGNTSFGRAVRG